jgi:peptide deformylase
MAYQIRTYGDPVLKSKASEVSDINGKIARLVDDMFDTLYESDSGIALAAPQIGCRSRSSCGTSTISTWPSSTRRSSSRVASGSTTRVASAFPVLYVEMLRPNHVLVRGYTVDGDEVEIEASELMGRLFQHEIDHLQGVLMFDRMTPEQRKEAMTEYRRLQEAPPTEAPKRRLKLQ